MTAGDKSTVMASLKEGLHKANALNALLEEELTLLKAGDLESFEALQAKKSETLEALSTLIPLLTGDVSLTEAEDDEAVVPLVEEINALLATCRDAHLRNAMLIDRKMEATRSALEVLRSSRSADTGETYDRLGKLKRGQSRGRETDV
ncbi:MAG: flagellar export chaperone FlgN [Luminiphilus sp.]|nr:flagellar export chaperone FlgN [Luminiphilus sp.]MBL6897275.1 flagellar export chaperone FlgN [Luminiphilus sp.]